ncbi:MAG TPA: hypothetical protein PKC58_17835 [Ignavibacteria bacterium]|nr:hypothetical protein [Ignavibacteria bacterium]
MKTKKILLGIGIGVLILLFFSIYKISTFTLFDDEFKVVESIKIPDRSYIIKIYDIPSNASSQSYIQIRKIENGVEEVLESYERFDHLDSYSLGKDTLVLTISDLTLSKSEVKKFPLPQ